MPSPGPRSSILYSFSSPAQPFRFHTRQSPSASNNAYCRACLSFLLSFLIFLDSFHSLLSLVSSLIIASRSLFLCQIHSLFKHTSTKTHNNGDSRTTPSPNSSKHKRTRSNLRFGTIFRLDHLHRVGDMLLRSLLHPRRIPHPSSLWLHLHGNE